MEYQCPMYESSQFLCDSPAVHLVNGTAICTYHAKILELRINIYGDIIPTARTKA
jgi:hypothetical protein